MGTAGSDAVWESIREAQAACTLFPPGSRVVAAVSGGQDSCTLVHALWSMRNELGIQLEVAHVHHGLRDSADEDLIAVEALAGELCLPFHSTRVDVRASAKRLRLSEEEAGRRARYAFLEGLVTDDNGGGLIALGHTQDDQVETILLNILRGTGVEGLRGMSAVAGVRVRPLLNVPRSETAAYCQRHGLTYHDDPSNTCLTYRRNRVRAELLPELEAYYNPGIKDALLRLGRIVGEESAVLDGLCREALGKVTLYRRPSEIRLSRGGLVGLGPGLQRRVLRMAIQLVRGDLTDVEFERIESIRQALQSDEWNDTRWSVSLSPGEVSVSVTAGECVVRRTSPVTSARRLHYELPISGSVLVPEWQTRFECEATSDLAAVTAPDGMPCVAVDASKIVAPLVVRNRRAGDRVCPVGGRGTRKLQDLLVDHKVPAEDRDRLPVISDQQGIVWVVGHAVDERVAVTNQTASMYVLRAVSLENGEDYGIL